MSEVSTKLRLIYLPYLLLLVAFPALYASLMWLLLYRRPLLDPPMALGEYALPLLVGGLVTVLALRRRFGLLQDPQNSGVVFSLWVFATLSLVLPTIFAQKLLVARTRQLLALPTIDWLPQAPPATYYSLWRHYVSPPRAGRAGTAVVQIRGKDSLFIDRYFSSPLWARPADTARGRPAAWLGLRMWTRLSNYGDSAARRQQYLAFLRQSDAQFARLDLQAFAYLRRPERPRDQAGYQAAVAASPGYRPQPGQPPVVLLPVATSFAQRAAGLLRWFWVTVGLGAWVMLAMVQRHALDPARVAAFRASK